jgi:hypothetical protein
MSKISRILVSLVGVLSIVLVAYVIFRPPSTVPEQSVTNPSIEEELDLFMRDRMDYGIDFSRMLAEKRLEHARIIARDHPEYEPKARTVIDTLTARLARRAKM